MARVKEIIRKREPSISEKIEARAQAIAKAPRRETESSVVSILESEIALTMDQIDRTRALHAGLHRDILHSELYIGTEILWRKPREPVYIDYRLAERDRLRDRILWLRREKRQLALIEEEKLQGLHDRLGRLLTQRDQLRVSFDPCGRSQANRNA